ncbi:MAG: site-specific integrase [Acidithiobacillus sp.]
MRNIMPERTGFGAIPSLPEQARTRTGVEFNPRAVRWAIRDCSATFSLDFNILRGVSLPFRAASQLALLWYAENQSPYHMMNMFRRLEHFLRIVTVNRNQPLNEITSQDLINYRTSLRKRDDWYLGSLSGLLQKWKELGYPGITDDALALLKQLRIPGNLKGEAVLTMDPEHGPFTDIEIESIQAGLDRSFSDDQISLESYLIVYLYMFLGQRSVQYAALKVCDVNVGRSKDETPIYTLRVPRAKQRAQLSRSEYKNRVLIPKIGELLVVYANQVRTAYAGRLPDPSDAPLFPAKQSRANEPTGFKFHRTSGSLAKSLEETVNKLNIISERTGQPIHITATRFRRTVGTRAATEGHGELIIAELLDHTDTQNVGVYVEATPAILERIDRAVAMQLAPLAQAFAGVIIVDESQATRAGDPSSRICDPRFDASMKPMGNCGKYGFCGSLAPISCYTCSNFQPWLDGPHEAVLSALIADREMLLTSTDVRIASINDRTILAVAEVVRRCDEVRKNASGGG